MSLRDAAVPGSAVPIRALQGDAQSLSREEFEDRHGSAFLLLTAAQLWLPRGPSVTEVALLGDAPQGESTASLRLTAFPLRSREGAPGGLVTVGRSAKSDVVVPDMSVSRLHAFAKQAGERWGINDAGSTNGTTVNDRNAPLQGHGSPLELKAGCTVRLGQVEFTFLDLDATLAHLAKL